MDSGQWTVDSGRVGAKINFRATWRRRKICWRLWPPYIRRRMSVFLILLSHNNDDKIPVQTNVSRKHNTKLLPTRN